MFELLFGIAVIALWRFAVRAHHRGLANQARHQWVRTTVTPMPPPYDDTPPVTLAQALDWMPPSIVRDFNCVRGPHEWLTDGYYRAYCKNCKATRRMMEVA